MKTVKKILLWILERISPSTVAGALKFAHKAIDGLEKVEAKALAETQRIDAVIEAHLANKAALAATTETAQRVSGNLRSLIA